MSHITSGTLLDENVFEEMQAFRKALCKMFESEDRDCVFYEIATGLKRHPHMPDNYIRFHWCHPYQMF